MDTKPNQRVICQICQGEKDLIEVWPGALVTGGVLENIKKGHPQWSPGGFICLADLNHFRTEYVHEVLKEEMGEIHHLKDDLAQSEKEHELLSRNINVAFEQELTFWDRMSDRVASFGGSWAFILTFFGVIIAWIAINSIVVLVHPFDPYPFIFLNLILSGMAGFQAPIILMSQNRQDAKDRLRSEHDYRLNLKAELEIRHLNEKMDLLLTHQWLRLLEIQRMQTEVMEEVAGKAAWGQAASVKDS